MEITRSELITALRRVGLLGSVDSGLFDNMLSPTGGSDHTAEIQELQAKDVTQDSRITANEAALLTKAGLINGRVPYEQLPEFPVGRKVNVANQAARFALPVYADLTIAYQSDTGDAWGLDANADPAISNNWSKLGNAQGIGVASFNGRTGNIGPMSGDYNTGQITEIVDKRFVTSDQITQWNTATSAAKVISFNGRSGVISPVSGDYTADLITEGTNRKWLTPTQISTWDAKETTTGSQAKATAAQTAAVSSAKTYADSTFIPLSQKGAANGVASLNASSKVPLANLDVSTLIPLSQKGANLGVATLDSTGKLAGSQVPTYLGQVPRIWREVKAQRGVNIYYRNNNASEQIVFVRHKPTTATTRFTQIVVRLNSSSQWFTFNTIQPTTVGASEGLTVTVPGGWEYAVTSNGGTTDINLIDAWYEMY